MSTKEQSRKEYIARINRVKDVPTNCTTTLLKKMLSVGLYWISAFR
ncbi:hypothetical protein [Marinilabilia sp.]